MLNCYEWLYEYYKGYTVVFYWMLTVMNGCMVLRRIYHYIMLKVIYYEFLYEYYEGFIVALYWTLTVIIGWMSNMKGLLLSYTKC
jgi:hypothetical protein